MIVSRSRRERESRHSLPDNDPIPGVKSFDCDALVAHRFGRRRLECWLLSIG